MKDKPIGVADGWLMGCEREESRVTPKLFCLRNCFEVRKTARRVVINIENLLCARGSDQANLVLELGKKDNNH